VIADFSAKDIDRLLIYFCKLPAVWLRKIHEEYEDKVVLASDVRQTQKEFILCFSFFDLNELPSIRPKPGSLYVFSYANPMMRNRKSIFGVCIKGLSISVSQLQLAEGKRWQMADTGRVERLTCFGACLRH